MSPRSGSEKRQRTTIVTMRISPQEAVAIRQLAQKHGETVSGLMRSALLHNRPRVPRVDLQALARLLGQLGKIGSNINQIAYHLNAGRPGDRVDSFVAEWETPCATCRSCALSACRRSARSHVGKSGPATRIDIAELSWRLTARPSSSRFLLTGNERISLSGNPHLLTVLNSGSLESSKSRSLHASKPKCIQG